MSLMEKIGTPIGSYAPDFELLGIDDQVHHLSRYLEKWKGVGVIFMSNDCPYVCCYLDRLKHIQTEFQGRGFTLVGINPNDSSHYPEDSFSNMKQFAREKQLNFPYLWDSTQDVAQGFGVEKMPEVFLIDQMGILRYRGQIDDNAQEPEAVQMPYLYNAIAALLTGDNISPKSTSPLGSDLRWRN
ncbi:MAG TPA: thioredoxin family protein [Cyanobacteria bacterium UBA12227]|nr:thioredoxin family protein [Cyanobacteria bacterium UBA12227]HAX89259.1 thioredoxin family protein [Cyanobacteria bacterium UBA11370]